MNTTRDMNPDPITGAPGSHPVGVGVGGAGGALAGAAVGSLAGPIGMLVGGAVGAIAGAAAGKGAAERLDPTGEADYWQGEYTNRPYYNSAYTYDDYAPAYGVGVGSAVADKYRDRHFNDIEHDLAHDWEIYRGQSRLNWPEASPAARAAWERAQHDVGAA